MCRGVVVQQGEREGHAWRVAVGAGVQTCTVGREGEAAPEALQTPRRTGSGTCGASVEPPRLHAHLSRLAG